MPPKFRRNLSEDDLKTAQDAEKERLLRDDDEDEDFFLRGPSSKNRTLNMQPDKVKQAKVEVDEVSNIMKNNIEKIIERGDRLEDLEDKSDVLSSRADEFRSTAKKMQTRMWWRNAKMKILLAFIILVILLIIFIPIIVKRNS